MIDKSMRIKSTHFDQKWFQNRALELGFPCPPPMLRKLWEFVVISQVFHECFGYTDASALGFGVGREPIPSWLAKRSATVVATDQAPKGSTLWAESGQYANCLTDLYNALVCSPKDFENVSYAHVDMNDIPDGLHDRFDFTWSSGSFEHLGSIENGLEFYCQQMKCLKVGGISAHTTEFNFASNDATLESDNLVLFRQRDFEDLATRLEHQGDKLWALDLSQGSSEMDKEIYVAPYPDFHINIAIGSHVTTSVLLIAERGGLK